MNVLEKILEEKELAAIKDLVEENEKCLNQCEGACSSIKNGMCSCDDGALVQAIRKMQNYLDVVTDTNVGGDNDTEEKIREHIAECLHRIDNIRSFIGSKKYSDEAKCRKNIDVLKKSIVAMEEYLRFKKRNDKDDWIPVEEGLPEINKKVLATVEHSSWISDFDSEWVPEDEKIYHPETQSTYLAYINENNVWIYMDEEGSENICDKEFGDNPGKIYDVVTHWQPLPEPYKVEEMKTDIFNANNKNYPIYEYRGCWIPEEIEKMNLIEQALGIKLFTWQKSYIKNGNFRCFGKTTAVIIRILTQGKEPVDLRNREKIQKYVMMDTPWIASGPVCEVFKREVKEIHGKLLAAGVKTNPVLYTEMDRKKYERKSEKENVSDSDIK